MINKKLLFGIVDQILVSGGSFATFVLCARYLSLEEQGKYIYTMSGYLLVLLLNIGAIYQVAPLIRGKTCRGYFKWLAAYQLFLSLGFSFFVTLFFCFMGKDVGWNIALNEIFLLMLCLTFQQLCDFDRRIGYIFKESSYPLGSSSVVYLSRVFFLVLLAPTNVAEVLIICIVSCIVPAFKTIGCSIKFLLNKKNYSYRARSRRHLRISLATIVNAPAGWLLAYLPLYILGVVNGPGAVAIVAAFRNLTNFTNIVMEQLETRLVVEWIRKRLDDVSFSVNRDIYIFFAVGCVGILIVLALLLISHKEITSIVLGDKYSEKSWYLILAWVAYGFYFVSRVVGIKLRVYGVVSAELIGNIFGVCFCAVFGYLMIEKYNEVGALLIYVSAPILVTVAQFYWPKLLNVLRG